MNKKIVTILLSMSMLFTSASFVFAEETDGNATPADKNEIINLNNEESAEQKTDEQLDEKIDEAETLDDENKIEKEENQVNEPVIAPLPATKVSLIVLNSDERYPFQSKEFGSIGKTYVSIRQCAELLGASIEWQENDQSVHIVKGNKYLRLVIGQPAFYVYTFSFLGKLEMQYGEEFSLATEEEKAILINDGLTGNEITPLLLDINGGATYLPIRAVAEALFDVKAPNGLETVAYKDGVTTFNIAEDKLVSGTWDSYLAERFRDESIKLPEIGVMPVATINVKVYGNFMGADPSLGDGVTVSVDGKTQTAANGGVCQFAEVKAGTYTVSVSNVPEGYKADDVTVIVEAGQQASVNIGLVKVEEKTDEAKEEVKEETTKSDVKSK